MKNDKKSVNHTEKRPKTILCIPSNWNVRTEIITAIAENNMNDFISAGMILLNLRPNKVFELEICERDDAMKESFRWAAMVNEVSEEFLEEIDKHKFVIYLSAQNRRFRKCDGNCRSWKSYFKIGRNWA